MKFSKVFLFGVATSSHQIEGAHQADGRTDSIWDTFSRIPGNVVRMENAEIACDHYNRYKEDVKIIKELGVDAYRFSIAWSRIFPHEHVFNPKGMDFYKRLLKELKDNDIKASVTLYHWDLPQWLQDMGGWEVRKSVDYFVEFAQKCFEELDQDVFQWITHNEPWCASILSNMLGEHAPGKHSIEAAVKVAHHLLLSHGEAVRVYKERGGQKPIGITLNLAPVYAASEKLEDRLAASNYEGYFNRWFLEPLFKGNYPFDILNLYASRIGDLSFIEEGDLERIAIPCDFLGINYYSRNLVKYNAFNIGLFGGAYSDYPKTAMGWDVSPNEFVELIESVRKNYTDLPIFITENGSAWEDQVVDGTVCDPQRVDYLVSHLEAIETMNDKGLNVMGYYCWSLMDNFEWSFGYAKRFGIVYVNFETQERIKKDSYLKYQSIIAAHRENK